MTIKLYDNDALLKECSAVVTACTEVKGKYFIELDRTVLFAEGGGQLSDRGKLNDVVVEHVSEKDGHLYHECAQPLAVGTQVRVVLDWNVRLDRMQQHHGEHILAYAFWKLFGANNVGFHMHEDSVFIDLDKELTEEEMLQAELLANEIVWENRPVHVEYRDSTQMDDLKSKMRKFNDKLTGLLRIVSVENADVCTCCGTHPPFTGMVGTIKIIRSEKHKGGIRVEFLCGKRALLDADAKNATLLKVAQSLSIKPHEVPAAVVKIKTDAQAEIAALKEKLLAVAEAEFIAAYDAAEANVEGTKIVALPLDGYDAKDIKYFLPKAAALENALTLILAVQPVRISYAAVLGNGAKGDCRAAMKVLNEVFGGRGGGKSDCAQGGSDYCADWQERLAQVAELLRK